MRGKTQRQVLEDATVCSICGGAPSPGDPLVVKDLNPIPSAGLVSMDADLTPNPQAVHRDCKPRRSPRPSVTAWGERGWHPVFE